MRLCVPAILAVTGLSLPAHALVGGTVTQLSTGSAAATQSSPQISGSNVVWTNTTSGASANSDIYFLDLSTAQPARDLTNTPLEQEFLEDVDGANVVWTHTSASAPGDVVVFDTTTNVPTTIAGSSASLHFEQPAIQGRYVVYLRVSTQFDVDGYDNLLGLPLARAITNDAAMQAHPRVSGDLVVYEDYNSGNADVFGYHIATQGPPFAIATGPSAQTFPDVDGTRVVWIDDAGGGDQVVLYDAATGAMRTLTSATSRKIQPRISGGYVVWADDRNAGQGFDVYLYNLVTQTEDLLVGGLGDQILADVDGSRVVYTSNSTGFEQVFLFTIADPPPPPPPVLPFGCDPAKTDLVAGPTTLSRTNKKPVYAGGAFTTVAGKDYYVCVENGLADGSHRTAHLLFSADGDLQLTPADFKPNANPPRYVSKKLEIEECECDGEGGDHGDGHDHHDAHGHHGCGNLWAAALYGAEMPSQVIVSIRSSH